MGYHTIVNDEYVEEVSEKIVSLCVEMNRTIRKYNRILKDAAEKAIISGSTHDELNAFLNVSNCLQEVYGTVGNTIKLRLKDFLSQIDETDKYLY